MKAASLRRFIRPQVLREAGRPRLERFLAAFSAELSASGVALPGRELSDEEYFCRWAALLLGAEGLPDRLIEALYAIEEMAAVNGRELLIAARDQAGIVPALADNASGLDLSMETWLAAPELFAAKHRGLRLKRLAKFAYYGSRDRRPEPVRLPGQEQLAELERALDDWFARHLRGRGSTWVEVCELDGEFWFQVRHGDIFARARAVRERRTEVLGFRPERDDVVVYGPPHDDLRVNARTEGERQLYRREFGRLLRGSPEYFCDDSTHTLEPLREQGEAALQPPGIGEIRSVTLREVKVVLDNAQNEFTWSGSLDLFRGGLPFAVPRGGRLAQAAFDFHLAGVSKPRRVEVRPPNVLKLGRHCDARLVGRFFCCRGFRRTRPAGCACAER